MSTPVFIEGISGVGKSTLSSMLCDKLHHLGHPSNCFLEGDTNSPLDLFYVSYLTVEEYASLLHSYPTQADELQKNSLVEPDYILVRYQDTNRRYYSSELYEYLRAHELCYKAENPLPLSKYGEVFLNLWARFARRTATTQSILIFDGSLLHHQINDLMRNYAASEKQIKAYLSMLIQTIEPLHPMVFYLFTQDVGTQFAKARQSRGQMPPTCEQVAFWEKRMRMDLSVLNGLAVQTHRIDISDGSWNSALERIVSSITNMDAFRPR